MGTLRKMRWWSVGLASLSLLGCGGGSAVIPTSYSSYNAKDGSFACDTPDGWEIKGGGKSGTPVWAKFTSGSALIHFKASSTNRLANASMTGRGAEANEVPAFAPVHLLHIEAMKQAEEEFEGYSETVGPTVMNCPLGPARMSEFTFDTTFGTLMHGYRISIIGFDRGVNVFCICPDNDWKTLKPVFDKVLASIVRGEVE
ncbi:MAG: hypothetical protein AAGD11_11085 [Planctomycetota bacterium]